MADRPVWGADPDEWTRHDDAVRWTSDTAPCMASTPGTIAAMVQHSDHTCGRPVGHPYAEPGSLAYVQAPSTAELMHKCSCGVAFAGVVFNQIGSTP